MTAKRKRLEVLEGRHVARLQGARPRRDSLAGAALELARALPEAERQMVEALGARGYADLLEASWAVSEAHTGDSRTLAQRAFALAFEGGTP
ncbi:hypothetical protein E7T09_12980 [Deinococcus sp. KSM4-11]|uniref:hypothetical protein n=1 Tax=Deinococcus sp. KSM4-11 TaxID=2568654 RepID=UPI0010A595A3|nr:hypothetical protein [Deinococcus sp. KSM4-11]THF86138.1 hypothetical protein E7T09_12980 [Deinococcus sp. KSM4-11]